MVVPKSAHRRHSGRPHLKCEQSKVGFQIHAVKTGLSGGGFVRVSVLSEISPKNEYPHKLGNSPVCGGKRFQPDMRRKVGISPKLARCSVREIFPQRRNPDKKEQVELFPKTSGLALKNET